MASLIVLSMVAAAMPVGNMNIFSDAMATGQKFLIKMTISKNTKKVIILI